MPSHSSLIVSAADQMMYPDEFNDSACLVDKEHRANVIYNSPKSQSSLLELEGP